MAVRQIGGLIESYDGLITAIRTRLAEVGSSCENVSALAGLTETHVSKLINAKRSKILGKISFDCLLAALGVRLVVVVDDLAFAPLKARLKPARFHRWNLGPSSDTPPASAGASSRGMKIKINEIGGMEEVAKVPALRDVVVVERQECRPKAVTKLKPRGPARSSEGLAGAI